MQKMKNVHISVLIIRSCTSPLKQRQRRTSSAKKTHCINPDEKCPPLHLTALQTAE